ncbi:iron-sulfur cluster assembly scaffold protein [Brucella haematophila]|uniref:Iron-sulfur cluster assembly scaffold protein n=1 Tax=Brucella haematophila TaxID=419474 RepID=A0ABX1DSI4_9HYPH|nr:iron-sulfur cluster assembly scaffold protein [Brucella haematophila]NKC05438.1 iron-sulfur cluster assembly scaffold protein [Brucella haematophila]TMU86280.1 iron-sulfur cluster assembly scaffold protein [Brucella haematophila]
MSNDENLAALYQERVRYWAAKVRNDRRLVDPEITITRTTPLCGSLLTLDVKQDSGTILALGYKARACTLGMASAAIVIEKAPGVSFSELREVQRILGNLLVGENVIFPVFWEELAIFSAAQAFPTRHGSIMLPFDVLNEAATKLI